MNSDFFDDTDKRFLKKGKSRICRNALYWYYMNKYMLINTSHPNTYFISYDNLGLIDQILEKENLEKSEIPNISSAFFLGDYIVDNTLLHSQDNLPNPVKNFYNRLVLNFFHYSGILLPLIPHSFIGDLSKVNAKHSEEDNKVYSKDSNKRKVSLINPFHEELNRRILKILNKRLSEQKV